MTPGRLVRGDLLGGAVGDEPALVDDQHPTAGDLDLRQDVRGQDDGARLAEPADQAADLDDLVRIEPVGGLVEDEQLRRVQQRLGEADALTIPARHVPIRWDSRSTRPHSSGCALHRAGRARRPRGRAPDRRTRGSSNAHLGVKRRRFGQVPELALTSIGSARTSWSLFTRWHGRRSAQVGRSRSSSSSTFRRRSARASRRSRPPGSGT